MFFASLYYDFESICYSQQCTHMRTVTFKKKKKIPGIDWMLSDNIRQSVSQWIYNSESVEGLFRIDGSRLMSDRSHNSLE